MSKENMLRLAVPDVISNSYFPAIAAVELGCFEAEGLHVSWELMAPVERSYEALKNGEISFVGGSSHSALSAFDAWQGVKLLCAQAQGTYWFLVMAKKFGATRGEVGIVKGKRIGAAPWVGMIFRHLLHESGIDPEVEHVKIEPVKTTTDANVNFGVAAAKALQSGEIDGFWANGMGAEVAVRHDIGDIVLDVRRGDGPEACRHTTMASIAATSRLVDDKPNVAAAAVRAIMRAQKMICEDPEVAKPIATRLFPAEEAGLIVELLRRDIPYYSPEITESTIDGMNRFACHAGLIDKPAAYQEIVAEALKPIWNSAI